MADYTISSIEIASARSRATNVQAKVAITEGEAVTLDSATGKYDLADASAASTATVAGLAVTSADADGYFLYVSAEEVDLGAILTAGDFVYLSATAGKLCPFADLVSTNVVTQIGHATTTSNLKINLVNTEVVKA